MSKKEMRIGSEVGWSEGSSLVVKYWLAVNRKSVSASPIALPLFPSVNPTPQLLIGFDTRKEQNTCQSLLLNGRSDKVERYVGTILPRLARDGKLVVKRFSHADTPRDTTTWGNDGGAV